ncbi:MAG: pyridoxal phosphate-dependent aminotransferase [Treponema sp.]|nr:pyridoxal phosphate-dependent aminotransferase [Treponema sp.]
MIAPHIKETIYSKGASVIRKMFEEGIQLKAKYGAENVYDFTLGNPDLDPPDEVVKAVKEVAEDSSHGRHGYMPNAGYMETRQAMAEKTAEEQGVAVSGKNILMTVGAASALNCVFKAILTPGDIVIVPRPFFAEYRHYVRNFQGQLIEVASKEDFSPDLEQISKVLEENGDKVAAVLINSPNNPSGKVYTESDIIRLTDSLKAHGKKCGRYPYLICDEPYRAIVYDGKSVAPVFKHYDETVIVTSFAKNLSLPGERIGYVAVNPKSQDADDFITASAFALRTLGCVNAPAFFQKVITKSWNAKVDYSSYEKRRNLLMAVLDKAGIEYYRPEGAFYLFCKVPAKWKGDDMDFCDYLKKYLILGAPGSGFGGPGWFRLAYCVSEETIVNSEKAFVKAMNDN